MISIQQYEQAVNSLSEKRKDILGQLYYIEPVKNASEIAKELGYKAAGAVNLQLGSIGKAICNYLNISPDLSQYNDRVLDGGYFIVIHRQIIKDTVYWEMDSNLRKALENLGIVIRTHSNKLKQLLSEPMENIEDRPAEIENKNEGDNDADVESRTEGGIKLVVSVRTERDYKCRKDAISIHGLKCKACEFDFERKYGSWGKNYIEVHHAVPLSEGIERATNPLTDLTVVCPNCHRMIHRKKGITLTIEELKQKINQH